MSSFAAFVLLAFLSTACQVKSGAGGAGGGVISGPAANYTTTISATTNKIADNVDFSAVTITVMDGTNPATGIVPTYSVSGSNNFISPCSATDATGTSLCVLKSTKAETKSINVLSPKPATATPVTFLPGAPSATKTTLTSVGPTIADGIAVMPVKITIKDSFGNAISGTTPIFTATGSSNTYGACSVSDATGLSNCSIKSLQAGIKTLKLTSPITMDGGPAFFISGPAVVANSTITGTSPHLANGVDQSVVTVSLKDINMNPVLGVTPTFNASGTGNSYTACGATDITGSTTCRLKSTVGETKVLSLLTPVAKTGGSVTFTSTAIGPVPANSTITGTSPVVADGVSTSTITITLRDSSNNGVSGLIPTFAATDTNSTNDYGTCSATNSSGVSTCTLSSTVAETKALMIADPIVKMGGNVTFIAGPPSSLASTITGTTPVVADGVASSTISILIADAFGNPIPGHTPTFSATDSGFQNIYSACSASSASGVSTCSLKSTIAETKTLQLLTPVIATGSDVDFVAGPAVAANSSITGTTPVTADGTSSSSITIVLRDANNNAVTGQTPTFSASDTGGTNVYGACSPSDASGSSTCSLKSTTAETKVLSIATPVVKAGTSVVFIAAGASVANSSITGSGPVLADGVDTSTITITLKDSSNNPVVGTIPTFSATDGGASNSYGICSATNASGISTCSLSSTKAETKTLSITSPITKVDGNVVFNAGVPVAANSTISGSSPTVANGVATSTITVVLKDAFLNPVAGLTPTFDSTGSSNSPGLCSLTDSSGTSTCTLSSTVAEVKTLSILTPVATTGGTATFIADVPDATNSTITGTGPVSANGSSTSDVTITLRDAFMNPVSGIVPTFSATDTGITNTYGSCSVTDASGVSSCTLASLKAETKTLSIATPILKADGTVNFTPGNASAPKSSITGTNLIVADGVATSVVTITLNDNHNNPVVGVVPTFSATDTGSTNNYGVCSSTDSSGISTCTLSSTVAEIKTLSITSPVSKSDDSVTFIAGNPSAVSSSITGSSPVVADGISLSTITITILDAFNNPVAGQTPTFSATNTGNTNSYGACTASDSSGIVTCSLSSTVAEIKTLSITSPVTKVGGTVSFVADAPIAANSSITGSSPVVADGISTSTITITLKDTYNNPVAGQTPVFSATDTGTTNAYGSCSSTNASGLSTCTLASTVAETKTLSITAPISKIGGTVDFIAGSAVAVNSTITGTGPVVADGVATSAVTITLKDASNNPVTGIVPTFSATDTGTTNVYSTCSSTDGTGTSTCTLKSTKAEVKTLSIATPVVKADGTVTFTAGAPSVANSTVIGTGPVVADGVATSAVTITLKDASNNPVTGIVPTFSATDTGTTNVYSTCSSTDGTGTSTCTLKSTKAEMKTLSIATPVVKADGTVTFTAGAPSVANSTIIGTGPVVANGTATSTISVTLLDAFSNPVASQTPVFSATDTGTTNIYGSCSSTNASGLSTCTLASTVAETKTLSITSPVSKIGGNVDFIAGTAVAVNSTISGTGPVVADGVATSSVTITLKDASNNPVTGIVPTFSATDTGTTNVYGTCSSSNASGVASCTLRSTRAEVKTLSIATPVVKADGTVTFTAGSPVAANSNITGTGPVTADGVATSTITVTLRDINNNGVSGQTPTFTATNTGNTNVYGTCSVSDATGSSTCTLRSTRAQLKTLTIATPVSKAGGNVTFVAGAASSTTSQITGTTPVSADGVSTSFISITLLDAFSNPISGVVPIFNATDTDSTNVYGACNASDTTGLSMCTLASTRAEAKTLQLNSPTAKTGSVVTFSSTLPTSGNSSITGTSPVLADGDADSTITITLKDGNNNPVAGITPNFDATDTSAKNTYDACSMSDASGISVCTMQSTYAEVKALRITSPVTKTGGSVTFNAGAPVAAQSTITGTGPVVADGIATSTVTITLKDNFGNGVAGQTPTFTATNTGTTNVYGTCPATNSSGVSTCTLASTKAEVKTLSIATPVSKAGGTVTFTAGAVAAATSTITGTGPTNPDGTSVSTITITLRDGNNNPVAGTVPTFTATGTNNNYNTCSSSNAAGVSTCTMSSLTAEVKTLSIATPVVKADGTVTFATGSPSVANSTITATGPVLADGTATSTITITLKDNTNAPVIGVTPTFNATGTSNTYNSCTTTDGSGVSSCTMTSTKAEDKTVSIASPVVKPGNTVAFQVGPASASTSTIECDNTSYLANGVDTCNITITILDAFNNPRSGESPSISVSGTSNTVSSCSVTNASGESFCTLNSTKAEGKFLTLNTPVSVANPTEYEFNPNGINLQVPIEMADRGLASNTSVVTFARTRTSIDPDEYEAATNDYFFEISASNTNTTTAYTVQLVNGAGAVIADSIISVPASTTATTRYRVQFTPSGFADTYRVRLAATSTASQLRVHSARIIIEQTQAVKTKIWVPLIGGDFAGESNSDTGGTATTTTSVSYVIPSNLNFYWFSRADANYDAIPVSGSWTLDVVLRTSNAAGIAYGGLFNRTTGQQVAEVSHGGNTTVTQKIITFNSDATNFVNGNDYELRIKSSSATYTAQFMKAGLWIKLKYLKKSDVWWRLVNRRSTTTTVALPDARFHYEAFAWSNPVANFVTFGSTTTTAIQLLSTGTSDTATTGSTLSSLTQPATHGRLSTPVSLVDNDRYIINHQRTTGTANMAGAFVIINVQE